MGLISWIIVGLIAGWLANQMMRGGRGNAVTVPSVLLLERRIRAREIDTAAAACIARSGDSAPESRHRRPSRRPRRA